MPSVRSRNAAFRFYVDGAASDLGALQGLADGVQRRYSVAARRAFSGLLRRAGPAASRLVREEYNVKAGVVSRSTRVQELTSRKGDGLVIWASTARIPLIEFGGRHRRRSAGATAAITKGGQKTYPGAFIATIEGRKAIRVRKTDPSTGKRFGRGPVRMLYGPSMFEMLAGTDGSTPSLRLRRRLLDELVEFHVNELRRQLELTRGA
jgi:hypothetical protein